jgi:hypothetical protein
VEIHQQERMERWREKKIMSELLLAITLCFSVAVIVGGVCFMFYVEIKYKGK